MGRSRYKPRPSGSPLPRETFSTKDLEEMLLQVLKSLEEDQPHQAREWLEMVPTRMQRRVEYLYARAAISEQEGDPIAALGDLDDIIRRAPDYFPAYAALADVYTNLEHSRHAWQAAEKFLELAPELEEDAGISLRKIIRTAKVYWADLADQLSVPLKSLTEAAFHFEKGQILLGRGKYLDAAHESEIAIRMIPVWAAPHNNRALALFYLGRVQEAIRESENALKQSPENLFAMANLIQFHSMVGYREKATPYVERLSRLLPTSLLPEINLNKIVESLAIYEADEILWQIAASLDHKMITELPLTTVYILGIAAAKTGHFPEAIRLLKECSHEEFPLSERAQLLIAEVNKARRGRIPPESETIQSAPYLHFTQVWPRNLADKLNSQLSTVRKPERAVPILERYMQQHPFMFGAMRLMLWYSEDEISRQMAVEALKAMETPPAYQELRWFVSSQLGSDQERVQVLSFLSEAGQLHPGESIRLWSSRRNQWTQGASYLTAVRPIESSPCQPKAMELIERSMRAQESAPEDQVSPRAIEYLEQAIQIDPQCAKALHNLGVLYIQQGKPEKGEPLVRRSLEVDPNYLFGYPTLAFQELKQENLEACEKYLEKVFTAPAISPDILERALICRVHLEIKRRNLDSAEQALDLLRAFDPDLPELGELNTTLLMLRGVSGWQDRWLENVHRYRQRQLKSSISIDSGLNSCLQRISREALTATLRTWGMPTAGRKNDVISGLTGAMTDPEWMYHVLSRTLSQEEESALRWLLETNGVRPWAEFTARFGSDFDESPYWQWHDPETIPGRLRMLGLLAMGTLNGDEVALIPSDLRPRLREYLK